MESSLTSTRHRTVASPLRASSLWFGALAIVSLLGLTAALMVAEPTALENQGSLSRLGVDPHAAGLFNTTLVLAGLLFVGLAFRLSQTLRTVPLATPLRRFIQLTLFIIPPALVVTGLFTVAEDTSHMIHNIAGFTSPVLVMSMMIGSTWIVPTADRFDQVSLALCLALAAAFLVAYTSSVIPYAGVEMVGFAICGTWLWAAEARWLQIGRARSTRSMRSSF